MKYRIKKERFIYQNGSEKITYYPQHKHLLCPFWHYYGITDAYSDYISYDTFDEALEYIYYNMSKHKFIEYIPVK